MKDTADALPMPVNRAKLSKPEIDEYRAGSRVGEGSCLRRWGGQHDAPVLMPTNAKVEVWDGNVTSALRLLRKLAGPALKETKRRQHYMKRSERA
ncbi:MAG TPA: hypothetical protein VJX92_19035 [Methylomirabilota bacterium]|nr:hypothetical protein [Methylomirabilota bacterium]